MESLKVYIPKNSSDHLQPELLFSCIATDLLVAIVKKQIDPVEIARNELANRYLNDNGTWVGFGK